MRRPLLLCILTTLALSAPAQKAAAHISGQAVYDLTQQYVNLAPHRYVGSADHTSAEAFIKSQFAPEAAKRKL